MEATKDISHFDDIGFSLVATLGENKHFVEFLAYKHLTKTTFHNQSVSEYGWYDSSNSKKYDTQIISRNFIKRDEACDIPTEDMEEAEVYLEGTIKFDRCSNWDFKTSEVLKHFCGVEEVEEFGELMRRTYNIFDVIMKKDEK